MPREPVAATTLDYEAARPDARSSLSLFLLAAAFLLAPFFVATIYTVFSRWPVRVWTARSDYMFEGIACVAGLPFALCLAMPLWARLGIFLIYAVLVSFVIETFMLYVIGYVFDDWL